MALSTIQTNNKLVKFIREFEVEWARENLFSPYQGTDMRSIIRIHNDLASGGEQLNIPMLSQLTGRGKGRGTLSGFEESLDDYGMRQYIDWARNAIVTDKAELQKESADTLSQMRPLLNQWADSLRRDETVEAMAALPSESPQVNLGSDDGDRVGGIRYAAATAAQRNTWNADNSDRVLYGNSVANYNATHATALANVDTTNDLYTASSLKLLKYVAKTAKPKIRPFKVETGKEYFVAFSGSLAFRDLQTSLDTIDKDGRAREAKGMDSNPLFQDGDELYRGVIAVEIPEIDDYVDDVWTTLLTAGAASGRVNPVFLCGQGAVSMAIGQRPRPTQKDDTDWEFLKGAGIEMAYGLQKMFKKYPKGGTKLVQTGMVTGFFANTTV